MRFIYWLCVLGLIAPVWATSETAACPKAAMAFKEKRYQEASSLAAPQKCPTLKALAQWALLKDGYKGHSFSDYQRFLTKYADWPWGYQLKTFAEKAMTEGDFAAAEPLLFKEEGPRTLHGLKIMVAHLKSQHQEAKAHLVVRRFWQTVPLSFDKTQKFLKRHGAWVTQKDHEKRFIHFMEKGDRDQQKNLLGAVTLPRRFKVIDKMLLGEGDPSVLYHKLSPSDQKTPEAISAYWRGLVKKEDPRAMQVFRQFQGIIQAHPGLFWKTALTLARDSLFMKKPQQVPLLLEKFHHLSPTQRFEQTFTVGWVSLVFLEKPQQALTFLEKAYDLTKLKMNRARVAYWMGKAHRADGAEEEAAAWFGKASSYHSTAYALFAQEALGQKIIPRFDPLHYTAADKKKVEALSLMRAIGILTSLGRKDLLPAFYYCIKHRLRTKGERYYFFQVLAQAAPQEKVAIARVLDVHYDVRESFPVLPPSVRKAIAGDQALVHAIIRQESLFKANAQSPAGAQGLMQVMPATAKKVCQAHGFSYRPQALLNDAAYNVRVGDRYLARVLSSYNVEKSRLSDLPVAFAAYNAGPARVERWLARYGDPRQKTIDFLTWVELIPYDETKKYILNVMANHAVYGYLLGFRKKIQKN